MEPLARTTKINPQRLEASLRNRRELPVVTVITAVLNAQNEIGETIRSVVSQDYPNIQYIIIDGGSTDATLKEITSYDKDIAFWVSEPDHGISDAWNKGIAVATGQYVSFLNAGDLYMPNAITDVITSIGESDFTWGDMIWVSNGGKETMLRGRDTYALELPYIMPFNHPTMFFKTDKVREVGGYSKQYRLAMDYDLVRKMVLNGAQGAKVPVTIVKMRAGGVHDLNYAATVAEVRKIAVINGAPRLLAKFAAYYTVSTKNNNRTWAFMMLANTLRLLKRYLK